MTNSALRLSTFSAFLVASLIVFAIYLLFRYNFGKVVSQLDSNLASLVNVLFTTHTTALVAFASVSFHYDTIKGKSDRIKVH